LHKYYRPAIVELMADLGDLSKVADIEKMLESNEFRVDFSQRFEDDPCLSSNAEDAAHRVSIKHGKPKKTP
jgi:hypothetical protein